MPPAKPSAKEEADFMNDLLSGIDDSFFNARPSPSPSPQKLLRPSAAQHGPATLTKSPALETPRKVCQVNATVDTAGPVDRAENCTRCVVEEASETRDHSRWGKVGPRILSAMSLCRTNTGFVDFSRARRSQG
jgi:DNA replication ATP-dependent helicase Dna2